LAAVLAAASVLVMLVGIWYPAYARARALQRRLGSLTPVATGLVPDHGGRRRARALARPTWGGDRFVGRLERQIERAGLALTAGEIVAAAAVIGTLAAVVGGVMMGVLAIIPAGAAGAALPYVWIRLRQRRRRAAFARQLPDTVALLASAVRAGHSLLQALEQVAMGAAEPTRSALEQVVREIGLGAPQDEALVRLSTRFPSEDLDLITASMRVQQQVGGSLATVLDDIADTLRDRDRVNGEIVALTAPQRYSAYVLALLPVFVTLAIFAVSHDYMAPLFEGSMRIAAAGAAVMVVLGFLVMQKMAAIDV
jgi:tight adherence protein B